MTPRWKTGETPHVRQEELSVLLLYRCGDLRDGVEDMEESCKLNIKGLSGKLREFNIKYTDTQDVRRD